MKRMSMAHLAKDLKLSKTTVSFVLNGKSKEKNISRETEKKVLEYANKVGYKPNKLAQSLSTGKTRTIGLIVPDISDPFYAATARALEMGFHERGYNIFYSSSYEEPQAESRLISSMKDRMVDGLIIASTQQNKEDIAKLIKEDFPFVLIDRHYPDIACGTVTVENYKGVFNTVKSLYDLGNQSIAFITLDSHLDALDQRLKGFEEGIQHIGSSKMRSDIWKVGSDKEVDTLKVVLQKILENKYQCVIFSTNNLTLTALEAIKLLNIKIPDHMEWISFGDHITFPLVTPAVSAIVQPVEQIAKETMDRILDQIEQKECAKHIVLPVHFTKRDY